MLVVVLIVVLAAAGGVAWMRYAARRRRIAALFSIATRAGFEFSEQDPHDTVRLPFALFDKGDGRRVENVMWGVRDDVATRLFDYWYYDESSDGRGSRSRTYHRFTCALLTIAADCPTLHITREGLLTRLANAVGFKDVELEYDDFNRRFRVHCDDQKFAFSLLDGQMMEWMMGADAIGSLEVLGPLVLIAGPKLAAPDWVTLADVGLGFVHHVPHVVYASWPPEHTR
jgi:hypothetical protein